MTFNKEDAISSAVQGLIDKNGGVYTDDIERIAGCRRFIAGRWLSKNGFVKPAGCTSRYWKRCEA